MRAVVSTLADQSVGKSATAKRHDVRRAVTRRWLFMLAVVASVLGRGSSARAHPPGEDVPATPHSRETLVIGSKQFAENRLLAEMLAQLIEAHTDLQVERTINLGGSTVALRALQTGAIDAYPEYTGTAYAVHLGHREPLRDPLEVYLRVRDEFQERYQLEWLQPFGFSNSYALAVNEPLAEKLGLRAISDLTAHPSLRVGLSHEFLERRDGWPGLSTTYSLEFDEVRGMNHGLAYEAIDTDRIDVVDTWTTDGKLLRYPLRLLEDDRHFFPPYDAAPVFRRDTLDRHPELEQLVNGLAFRIDDDTMRRLNARVEDEGAAFERVASDFLRRQGLLETEASSPEASHGNPSSAVPPSAWRHWVSGLWSECHATLRYLWQHIWLTTLAVLLAIAVALPLGIVLTRRPRWAPPVMGAAGVIQTVPSLALLVFMIPLPGLGLGARSAIAALFLYALLPILRNTFSGIREVDPDLVDAARAMGLRELEILRLVELPLATQTIMAGIRTATVISIGVATLAAFIGAGGLGDPIITGLQLNDVPLILSGAIPAALLALTADFLLGRLERVLVPRGIR